MAKIGLNGALTGMNVLAKSVGIQQLDHIMVASSICEGSRAVRKPIPRALAS